MHERTALLLALAAALIVPTAAAQDPASPLPGGIPTAPTTPTLDPALPIDAEADLATELGIDAGVAGIAVDAQADAEVSTLPPTVSTDDADDAGAGGVATNSLAEQVVDVAAPAAGFSLLALLIGSLVWGVEAMRALPTRIAGLLGKFGRGLLGLVPIVPLFSRIERGSLLDNPIRARVHDVVAQDPGVSLSEVTARAGIAWGTAVHHLRRLEAHGAVVSVTQLGHHRYFVANTPAATQRTAMAVVMHPTARRIAHLVSQRPGIDQTGICQALGLNNPAASKHLSQFEAQGLVLSQRAGRSRLYHPTGGLHSALLLLEPAPVVSPVAATMARHSYAIPGHAATATC